MSNWRPSNIDEAVLAAFTEKGLFLPKVVAHWRAPVPREAVPRPWSDKVVSFLAFHERGLGYPAHWFLRGLLNEWGLELQHLNPTGVLHITNFITVHEAFLRMEPHADFFRRMFSRRALTVGNPAEITPVGGFALQRKSSSGGSYPAYIPCDSNRGWHGEWFYIRNPVEASFPVFTSERLEKQDSWSWGYSCREKKVEISEVEL